MRSCSFECSEVRALGITVFSGLGAAQQLLLSVSVAFAEQSKAYQSTLVNHLKDPNAIMTAVVAMLLLLLLPRRLLLLLVL